MRIQSGVAGRGYWDALHIGNDEIRHDEIRVSKKQEQTPDLGRGDKFYEVKDWVLSSVPRVEKWALWGSGIGLVAGGAYAAWLGDVAQLPLTRTLPVVAALGAVGACFGLFGGVVAGTGEVALEEAFPVVDDESSKQSSKAGD